MMELNSTTFNILEKTIQYRDKTRASKDIGCMKKTAVTIATSITMLLLPVVATLEFAARLLFAIVLTPLAICGVKGALKQFDSARNALSMILTSIVSALANPFISKLEEHDVAMAPILVGVLLFTPDTICRN